MTLTETQFRNRAAWTLANEELTLTVVQAGGHLAELKLINGGCPNLLWQPPWNTLDPDAFVDEIHGPAYGGGSEARLLSGILGHNLCFPFWGHPTSAEYAAGATFHGESNIVRWRREASPQHELAIAATMPGSQTRMRRVIRLEGAQVRFHCTAENLTAWDKPVAWCEHVTFGPPFLSADNTEFEASLGAGFVTGKENGEHFHWPQGRGEISHDLRRFASSPHSALVNSFLVDASSETAFFRASNRDLKVAIEYRFAAAQFPWLNIWQNNDERMQTRGMEFSNTPRDGTMRVLVQSPAVLNTPAYDWIDARGTLHKQFTISVRRL